MDNYTKTVISGIKVWAEKFFVKKDDISDFVKQSDIPEGFSGSWNDLEDRPFGDMVSEVVLFDESNMQFNYWEEYEKAYCSGTPSPFGLFVIGNNYSVVWDGVKYADLTAFESEFGEPAIGSQYSNITNEMPFYISTPTDDGVTVNVVTNSALESHSLTIMGPSVSVRTLDDKYLPDTIATKAYVDENIAAIPTPDTSGQIETHNTSEEAHADIRGLIDAIEIPTNVSAFTNDKGYLTEVPSEYITETELTNKGYQTASQVNTLINNALGVIENGSY